MWKRAKRIGLLLIFGIVVVSAGAVIFVQTSAFQQWLLRRIETAASAAGFRFSAGRLNLNIWRLQAAIDKIALDDSRTATVRIDRLFIKIPWNVVQGGVINITDLEADGVDV